MIITVILYTHLTTLNILKVCLLPVEGRRTKSRVIVCIDEYYINTSVALFCIPNQYVNLAEISLHQQWALDLLGGGPHMQKLSDSYKHGQRTLNRDDDDDVDLKIST